MNYLLSVGLLITCSISANCAEDSTHHWDLLIFTQSWPQTVCREWKEKDQSHSCQMPSKEETWTIHGIWPTKLGSIGPAFCNKTWHFNPDEIKPIENDLDQLWTNVESGTSTYSFWSHEWQKHGTCAAMIEQLNSEMKYFNQGLEWMQNVSMTDILGNVNIIPSNNKLYSIVDINQAIIQNLGTNPVIRCHKENGKDYVAELRICFDKSLRLENCDGVMGETFFRKYVGGNAILTNCDTDSGIIYSLDWRHNNNNNNYDNNNINYDNDDYDNEVRRAHLFMNLFYFIEWLRWFTF